MHHCKCGCTLISICIDSAPYLPLQQLALLPLLEHLVALQEGPPPLGGGNNPVEQRPLLDGPRRGPPGGLRRRSRLLQMALQLLDGVLPSEGWMGVCGSMPLAPSPNGPAAPRWCSAKRG
eukprot:4817136-Pyramimonas_sp.AAC.1